MDLLKRFDIDTVSERVVVDGNRITGGGVTSGIDFSLMLTSILFGEQRAKEIQLLIEYNPSHRFIQDILISQNILLSKSEKRA